MSEFKVSIVSSNEEIFSGTADMLYATGSLGEIGIAPGHSPLLTGLMPGPVRVCNEDKEEITSMRLRAHRDELISLENELSDRLELKSDGSLFKTPI